MTIKLVIDKNKCPVCGEDALSRYGFDWLHEWECIACYNSWFDQEEYLSVIDGIDLTNSNKYDKDVRIIVSNNHVDVSG